MKYLFLLLAAVLLFAGWFYWNHSRSYFREPLAIDLELAANFGELRKDHFHMGMDIRTRGEENLPVYAVADGYISHVSVSELGLGKALFIVHPNGQTSIYGHLNRWTPALDAFVHTKQYAAACWEQELDLPPGRYPVKKGALIASSGNTGNSYAPHLHFELRDTRTGCSINPLLAGFSIPDRVPPQLKGLYWYDRRYSTYRVRAQKIEILEKQGGYTTKEQLVRVNSPLISLGFAATDKSSNSPHLSGIFRAALWKDGVLVNDLRMDSFPGSGTRYINACIDYAKWVRMGMYVQHLSVLPGNHLPVFKTAAGTGIIFLGDGKVHTIHLQVSDIAGNHSDLSCQLQFNGAALPPVVAAAGTIKLVPNRENDLKGKYVRVRFDAAAFYDTVPFVLQEGPDTGVRAASRCIQLHDPSVPVHDSYYVQVMTTVGRSSPLRDKVVMQLISGGDQFVIKGIWNGDWMGGRFNQLGMVHLLTDLIAPLAAPQGWTDGARIAAETASLEIRCSDDLGRVAGLTGLLDGHWILFARKGNNFTYTFDERCPPGRHQLEIRVKDVAGNETRRRFSFTRA